jgi:hypothetical protein
MYETPTLKCAMLTGRPSIQNHKINTNVYVSDRQFSPANATVRLISHIGELSYRRNFS